jgi:predicted PurR-regulated permease PerM
MAGNYKSEILFAFTIAVALLIAYVARHVLLIIYVSILFAVVVTPLVTWVQKLKLGRWHPNQGVAIAMIVVAGAVILGLFGFFAIPPITSDMRQFARDWPEREDRVFEYLQRVPLLQDLDPGFLQDHAGQIAKQVVGFVPGVAGAVFAFASFLILTIYFILDGERAAAWLTSLFPKNRGDRLLHTLGRAKDRMRRWMTGQLLLMLILGTLSLAVYGALGLRYVTALAVFTGAANIVPVVGPVASIALAALVAAFDSWVKVVAVLAFYAIYQQLENAFLTPRIMKAAVGMPPLAVIVALVLGGELAGPVGALVAVPSAALVAVLADEYLVKPHAKSPA